MNVVCGPIINFKVLSHSFKCSLNFSIFNKVCFFLIKMCQNKRKLKSKKCVKNLICNQRNVIKLLIAVPLVFLFIIFFKNQFNPSNVLSICVIVVVVCVVGILLVFSRSTLCFFSLLIPQICSRRGRAVMVAYIFVLTLKYPTKNLLHNIEVLTDSISCGQVTRLCFGCLSS